MNAGAAMPSRFPQTLAELRRGRVVVACDRCGRRGDYSVAKLRRERGAQSTADFLAELTADCPLRPTFGRYETCPVHFVG
jgi:hypothetical protein